MIEIRPKVVDRAFLYFHTRCSRGDELSPFVDEIREELPNTYVWAGDGCIEGKMEGSADPLMGREASHGVSSQRYWFVFPMHANTPEEATAVTTNAMGAVLITSGGYANALADQILARFHLAASRVVLCGHQHGACVALAAAMMRRKDPFALTVLLDPWPWETQYLQHEQHLPSTKVVCVDNLWVREREKQRGAEIELYKVFRSYGMNAEGVTLTKGRGKPDRHMFREAIRAIQRQI